MTPPRPLRVNARIEIPRSELQFSFVRSSGPGGQNVNKVASKAVLRWNLADSPSVPADIRDRLTAANRRRINDRGELILTSQRYRDQLKNINDCLEKLSQLIVAVASPPRRRKKTRVPKSAREARLRQKRSIAEKKQRRKRPTSDF